VFELERRIWTIPAERSKNDQQYEVPVSDLALTFIRHLRVTGEIRQILPRKA
jgi:hypothetical protein